MPEILGTALEFELQLTQALDMELESPPALDLHTEPGGIVIVPTEESPVSSVNGKTGNVELDAEDVGALPDSTVIPSAVSHLQNDLRFVTAETAPGKLNYVDTIDPLGGIYYRSNAARDGNKLRLTYQDPTRNTYFYIFLSHPLETGKTYTLSFDCSGIETGQVIRFRVARFSAEQDATIYDEGAAISNPFALRNGKNAVTFTMTSTLNSMVRLDDVLGTGETRPTGTDIVLENFQIEDGSTATAWHPSMLAAHNAAERIETLTRAMLEKEGWAVGLMDEEYLSASKTISKSLDSLTSIGGVNCSTTIYEVLPFPMKEANPVGTCDKLAGYIGSTDAASATHDGASVKLGISFRDYFPGLSAAPSPAQTVYNRVQIAGRVATPPKNPGSAFATPNQEIGAAIVAVAESYVTAMNPPDHATAAGVNQKYSYGKNFFYQECDIVNIVENGAHLARMECDTFVGLVLRGIDYDHSPFKSGNYALESKTEDGESFDVVDRTEEGMSSGTYLYDKVMSDTASVVSSVPWATALRAKLSESSGVVRYFKHDARTAAEFAWMFWMIGGCLFTNPAKAAPGDVAFFRSPQTATWFDGITHIAIVGQPDAGGGMTIYEMTGYDGESAGKHLQHVSLANRSSKPAYFARPYGWT